MDNIRYLVVTVDPASPSMEDPTGDDTEVEVFAPRPCKDAAEVIAACREAQELERDWSVWELVDGKFRRRGVTYATGEVS